MAKECLNKSNTDLSKITLADVVTLDQAQQAANEKLQNMETTVRATYAQVRRFLERCCSPVQSFGKTRLWHKEVIDPLVAYIRRNIKD